MKLSEVKLTEEFGVERRVTVFELSDLEKGLINDFERNKESISKEIKDSNYDKSVGEASWKKLNDSMSIIEPITVGYLTAMQYFGLPFKKYGKRTNFGPGFEVYTEPIIIVPSDNILKVNVSFSFHPVEEELYCWGHIDLDETEMSKQDFNSVKTKVTTERDTRKVYLFLEHIKRTIEQYGRETDGINVPYIEGNEVNSVTLIPKVIQVMQLRGREIHPDLFDNLIDLEDALYDETKEYGRKRRSVIEALEDKRGRLWGEMKVSLINPELN